MPSPGGQAFECRREVDVQTATSLDWDTKLRTTLPCFHSRVCQTRISFLPDSIVRCNEDLFKFNTRIGEVGPKGTRIPAVATVGMIHQVLG